MTSARRFPLAGLAFLLCCITAPAQAASFLEFVDPNPAPGNLFGSVVVPLSTGNVVITSPNDDFGGTDAGAVYLFDGSTGALISTLRGSTAGDRVGNNGVTALTNGNYVIRSLFWDNGVIADAGAVTWGSGTTGVSGTVSAANSLVGSSVSDEIGEGGVTALTNGNYVVASRVWDVGGVSNVGAVTWGSGTTGVTGTISIANSLVGATANDQVGNVTALTNGNYVVSSGSWDNGATADVGAVRLCNGTTGVSGKHSIANSLVGSTAVDAAGSGGVRALANGNYVVLSPAWDGAITANVGAVTWGSGTTGVTGTISAANSLVGSTAVDMSPGEVTALTNGNFVVSNPNWNNGSVVDAGAVTWCNGTTGVSGTISAANSLVGSTDNDQVGLTVTTLPNGNYVVQSTGWDNGASVDAGAVTWGSGTTGVSGTVSAANSLVGSGNFNAVGSAGVEALTNGNYVVLSPFWDNGGVLNVGAVTWASGTTGSSGTVSAANSLVGSIANDRVGGFVAALANGNYVVSSSLWDNGAIVNAGAVTWASGTAGFSGTVSAANSLVGSTAADQVGSSSVRALISGNYVVTSPNWDNGAAANAGAATWGNGTTGVSGPVSVANSLVGSATSDAVGNFGVAALANGHYVVLSPFWNNGATLDVGAATWGSGAAGLSGTVSGANSLVGSTANDRVGFSAKALANGNYVVTSPNWDNGAAVDAGAATWGSGAAGLSGMVSPGNSLVGSTSNTGLALAIEDPLNGTFISAFPSEGGGRVRVGSTSTVSVPDPRVTGLTLSLQGPQPNPARSEFRYAVTLPEAMRVRVDLYDVAGRRVHQLVDRHLTAGHNELEWNRGTTALGPGLYFLRLQGVGGSAARPIVILE